MENKKYKFLEHTADVKFQAFGKTLKEAFENSALALKETITRNEKINSDTEKTIEVEGEDKESLLYNFLEEFLFLLDSEEFILSNVKEVEIEGNKLTAKVVGDKASNYNFSNDVKAITYSEMEIKEEKSGWTCQVVLDV